MLHGIVVAAAVTAAIASPKAAHVDRYPVPPQAVVIHAECPGHAEYGGCTSGNTVWIKPGATRFDTSHEYGHVRWNNLTPELRDAYSQLLERYSNPAEIFADAYAACDLHLVPRTSGRSWVLSYGYDPSRRLHRYICATFDALFLP